MSGVVLSPAARRRLAWGTGLLWLESALRLGTVAVVAMLIARAVGPAGFGLLNLASALAALGTVALSRGLEWPLISAVASGRLDTASAVRRLLRVRLFTALAALALAALAATVLRPGDGAAQAVVVIVALGIVAAVPLGLELGFRARAQPLPGALARLAGTLLASAAKLGVLAVGDAEADPRGVVLALAVCVVLETAVSAAVLALAWWRSERPPAAAGRSAPAWAGHDLARDATRDPWPGLQQAARPLWASALVGVLLIKLDLLVVGALLGDAAAGRFALAAKLVEVLCLLPVLMLDQWQPLRLARGAQGGSASAARPGQGDTALFDAAFGFGVVLALANLVLAPWFVPALFGPDYADTVPVLQCLGLAVPLIALDAARQRWMAAQASVSSPPRLGLHLGAALLVAVPLWPLAAWSLGAVGVAAVSVLAWAVATVLAPQLDGRAVDLAAHSRRALWPWARLGRMLRERAPAPLPADPTGDPTGDPTVDAGGVMPEAAHEPPPGVAAAGLRALFVHQSAQLYGSDRALLGNVRHWIAQGGRALVVLPGPGPLEAELARAGAEVHRLARPTLLKLERSALGPRGLLALAGALFTLRPLRHLDAVVGGRRIDLVHTQTLAVLAGAWWARWRGVPHLWHVHEIVERPRWMARLLPRLLEAGADRVVCNAHATAAWVLGERPGLRERLAVVWNSLDRPAAGPGARPDAASEEGDVSVAAPPVPPRTPPAPLRTTRRIGVIGRINRMKGQGVLVEAAERLVGDPRLPPFELVIAGDAPPGQPQWQQRLAERVAASPLAGRTELAGFVADVPALLATLDILVVPSTAAESFGLVALEAMAAGVPVVASRIGGLPEVLGEGPDAGGLLVPAGDARALAQALHTLLRDEALRARLGAAGQRRSRSCFADGAALLLRQQLRAAGRPPAPGGGVR